MSLPPLALPPMPEIRQFRAAHRARAARGVPPHGGTPACTTTAAPFKPRKLAAITKQIEALDGHVDHVLAGIEEIAAGWGEKDACRVHQMGVATAKYVRRALKSTPNFRYRAAVPAKGSAGAKAMRKRSK